MSVLPMWYFNIADRAQLAHRWKKSLSRDSFLGVFLGCFFFTRLAY